MSETVFSANAALDERTTSEYVCTFKTPKRAVIPAASITSVRMTLTAQPEGTVINSRNDVETLGDNGSFDVTTNEYTLVFDPADLVMVGTPGMQARRLVLNVTYTDGEIPHVVTFFVKNLPGVG